MTTGDLTGCVKRLGHVLLGKVEPSVEAVRREAAAVMHLFGRNTIEGSLQALYDGVAQEEVPADILGTLNGLRDAPVRPRHYSPTLRRGRG